MSFCLSFLASRPEVQEKIVEEYKRVKGEKDSIEFEDVKELVYTQSVFKETLRLMPPVVEIPKKAVEDTQLGDYFIPKGTYISIDTPNLHRNPKYWKEPEKFDPERWTRDEIFPNSFAAFSIGSRSCIGMNVAQVEGAIILALLVTKYKLSQPEGGKDPSLDECATFLTTTPLKPIKVKFERKY